MRTIQQAHQEFVAATRSRVAAPKDGTRLPALTIRTRLAVGYGAVMVIVLTLVTVAVGRIHSRLGTERIDADLGRAMHSVAGVVDSEIDERLELGIGAHEALYELELPGMGASVFDTGGTMLAMRASGVASVAAARLSSLQAGAAPVTLEPEHVRAAASRWTHGEHRYIVAAWMPLEPLVREHATVMNTLRVAIPFAAAAALLGGWLIVWRALRPLSAMATDVDAIDRRNLTARLPLPVPTDDVRRLAVAFNALLDRLTESMQAQRRFMADASHELRTPVSIVRTTAQVTLSAAHRGEPEYREALEIVAAQAARLSASVDDMLLLALTDVAGRPLLPRYLYLDELVAECVKGVGVLAEPKGVRIHLDAPDGVHMRGDEELLRRMVTNLLDNAVRYSPDRTDVRVTLRPGHVATLSIENAGPGIDLEAQDRIFERFVRLESSQPTPGAGLGLPIARWVAEQHGGTIRVESDADVTRFIATVGSVAAR